MDNRFRALTPTERLIVYALQVNGPLTLDQLMTICGSTSRRHLSRNLRMVRAADYAAPDQDYVWSLTTSAPVVTL